MRRSRPRFIHAIKRELGGVGIVSGYGLTECPAITMGHREDGDEKLAHTEGRPSPRDGARVWIVKCDGSEQRAAIGDEGEVRVHGPAALPWFHGYVDPVLDASARDAEGFFRTGDLGRLDAEGHLVITGRLKDVIIRNGENISAKELEDLLFEHPAIADVAVVGIPDPDLGERCCAVVVPRNPSAPPALSDLGAFLVRRGLMKQKIPERLELVAALPRNANGKIDKRALRDSVSPRR